jgi:hypothetical protein
MARNTARLTQPVHRGQGFLQTRLGTCAMQDLEETLERLFKRLGAFSQAQFGFKYSASSRNSGFGSTLCENELSYRNAKTHRAERSRTIRPAPGNFLTSSLIAFLRRANRCSAGLSFLQIEQPGAPPGGPPRAELLLLLPHMTDDRLSY